MSKLTLTDILAGYASNDALNANWDSIIDAIENTLSRDGTTPNQMEADLDMNGYAILNQLATSGDANFSWRGNWTTGTSYSANNLVYVTTSESASNGGATYICTTDHTAGATFDGDLSAYWTLFAKRGGAGAGTGDMLAANNLSDVANASTSRTNLGLAIGTDVQAYDADTAKLDVAQSWTAQQTFKELKETVYALSGTTPAFDPANGTIQTWTLTGNSTPTDSLEAGQAITLMVDDGTAYTITWPTMEWRGGSAPTLPTTGYAVIELWKVGSTLYGAHVGDMS